jgi:hypothetical protein
MFSQEASIIATKEAAEVKMIEFFIPKRFSVTAPGIQSQSAVDRKSPIDTGVLRVNSAINSHSDASARSGLLASSIDIFR